MREDEVILALECHEARIANRLRQHQAMLEGHSSVPATVQHESWNVDARQQRHDVDASEDVQQTNRRFSRCGEPLELIEPPHLFKRGVWHDERRKHLPGSGIVLSPPLANERDRRLSPGHVGRIAARAPPLSEAATQDEPRHTFGVSHGIRNVCPDPDSPCTHEDMAGFGIDLLPPGSEAAKHRGHLSLHQ